MAVRRMASARRTARPTERERLLERKGGAEDAVKRTEDEEQEDEEQEDEGEEEG
jgi:hypothetical protein